VSGRTKGVIAAAVVVLALAAAAVWWFVLRDTADPEADVDAIDSGEPADGSGPDSADGEWTVQADDTVFVGYRVDELFAGETVTKTATGRTPGVEGTMTVDGQTVTAVDLTADVTQLASDQERRDSALATRGLETQRFPTAEFRLTSPVELPAEPAVDEPVETTVTGDLTLHGVTEPVEVELEARWSGPTISVAGSAPITFADYDIQPIEIPGFVSTAADGTMELQLLFVPAS
jgi:polyisoprenoid-binding protein YceI